MLKLGALGAPLVAGVVAGALAACGSEAASGFAASGADAGSEDSGSSGFDSGAEDGATGDSTAAMDGPSADAGAAPTGVLFVHAAPDVLDARLCWFTGSNFSSTEVPFPSGAAAPASNYPSLPVGGAVAVPDASDFVGTALNVAVIPAEILNGLEGPMPANDSCADWLKATSPLQGASIYTVSLAAGRIVTGATNVVALVGCPAADANLVDAGASEALARCGPGYDPAKGNLRFDVVPLHEVSEAGAGLLPVQAAQLSPAMAQLAGDAGAVVVSFGPQGSTSPIASLTGEGTFAPSSALYLDAGTSFTTLGFGVDIQGSNSGPGHLWMSLEQSLELQSPTVNPAVFYAQGTTYVVAIVGDPNAPRAFEADASFDGRGLHVLVLPLP